MCYTSHYIRFEFKLKFLSALLFGRAWPKAMNLQTFTAVLSPGAAFVRGFSSEVDTAQRAE